MRLTSARDLKNAIASDRRWLAARSDDKANMAIGVALGSTRDDHRIAVRAESEADVNHELLAHIAREAVGEIDLKFTGPRVIEAVTRPVPPPRTLAIGASAAHYNHPAGTIGFFAKKKDGTVGLVSNNHVFAVQNCGVEADEILHPAPADSGRSPNDVIAHLCGDYPRLRPDGQTVDCAFARLVDSVEFDPLALTPAERLEPIIATAGEQLLVEKIGRTTGRTQGIITAIDLDFFDVEYRIGRVAFSGQIEIEAAADEPFCRPGDSGSLVFTLDRQPLALLFLNTRAGGRANRGRGYANPIGAVLSALGVTFAS